jgi:hypothetical protein
MSHQFCGFVSIEGMEGDREDRAEELLWPTATKRSRGGHGEASSMSPQDIAMDLEHPDQLSHGSLYVHALMHLTFETKAITNINFFFIQNNCLLVFHLPIC